MTEGGPRGRAYAEHPHAPTQVALDTNAWRARRARRRRQKLVTKDLSRMDLSAQIAHSDETSRETVTHALLAIVASLDHERRLAVRAAVLIDKGVDERRRADLLKVAPDRHFGLRAEGILEIELGLRATYGFVPRYQLRWCGNV